MAVDAGTIYSEIRIQLDKIKGDIQKTEALFDKFGSTNKQQSEKVKKSWTNSFKNINLAGVAAFAAIGIAVKKAVTIFADFEQSIANVQAVTGATGDELQRLEEVALNAGETTRFTATQAAEALYLLASAGLDARESAEALDGTLQLAGATGSDLASTTGIVVATLSQYSLNASEAEKVSNVFAAAIGNSQANMEKLGSALKNVGPIAGSFNISLEETTASLQALFNAGFSGEQAGVALRNILLDLGKKTGPVVKRLEQLGIAFEDVNPQKVGLTGAIETLANSGIDLSQVFDKRVTASILSLAKVGGDGLRELEDAITGTNAAAEQYATQNDTLKASIDFLKSALESAAIKLVKELSPAIRGVVDFITMLVKGFNSLPGPVKLAVALFAGGIPVIAGVGAAVTALGAALGGALGPITATVAGISALVAAFTAFQGAQQKELIVRTLERAVVQGRDLNEEIDMIAKNTGLTTEQIIAQVKENKTLTDEIETQRKALEDQNTEREKAILLLGENFRNAVKRAVTENEIFQVFKKRVEALKEIAALEAEQLERQAVADEINAQVEEEIRLLNLRKKVLGDSVDFMAEKEKILLKAIEDGINRGLKPEEFTLKNLARQYQEIIALKEKDAEVTEEDTDATEKLVGALQKTERATGQLIEGLSDKTKETIRSITDTTFKAFQDLAGALQGLFRAIADERIRELDRQLEAELKAAGVAEETERERLQRELQAAIDAGDEKTANEIRDNITRLKIEEEYAKKKAMANYRAELAAWRLTLSQAIASAIAAVINVMRDQRGGLFTRLAAAGSIGVATGIQVRALRKAKPEPPKFQTGGIVVPAGSEGRDVTVAENGSPELLLNAGSEGQAFLRQFASEIASQIGGGAGGGTLTLFLSVDGKPIAESSAKYYNNGIVRLKV